MLSLRLPDSTRTVHAKLTCEDWFPIGSLLLKVRVVAVLAVLVVSLSAIDGGSRNLQ